MRHILKKRVLTALLILSMILLCLPTMAIENLPPADLSELYIGNNTPVTMPTAVNPYTYGGNEGGAGANAATLPDSGWTWNLHYDSSAEVKYTLTLNNANIVSSQAETCVTACGDLHIVLEGNSFLTGGNYGISSLNALNITSFTNGTLTVTDGSNNSSAGGSNDSSAGGSNDSSVGINVDSLMVQGGTLTAIGGTAKSSWGAFIGRDASIYNGSLIVKGGDNSKNSVGLSVRNITVSNGTLTCNGGSGDYSMGINARDITVTGNSVVTGTGGNGNTAFSSTGVFATNIRIDGGQLTGTGGAAVGSDGVYVTSMLDQDSNVIAGTGNLIVSGGKLTGVGGKSTGFAGSAGVLVYEGNFQVSGGELIGIGGESQGDSLGVVAREGQIGGTITVTGGTVLGTGGKAAEYSYGIACFTYSTSPTDSPSLGKDGITLSGGKTEASGYSCATINAPTISTSAGTGYENGYKWKANTIPSAPAGDYQTGPYSYSSSHQYFMIAPDESSGGSSGGSSDETFGGFSSGDSYFPGAITLNNPASNISIKGEGLSFNDKLLATPLAQGSDYEFMLRLVDRDAIIGIYDISLQSGKKAMWNGAELVFNVGAQYAGQSFTLIHKKADGSLEYFRCTADATGKLVFSTLYELSPFMLVKGSVVHAPPADMIAPPKTGDYATSVGWIMLLGTMAALLAAIWHKKAL